MSYYVGMPEEEEEEICSDDSSEPRVKGNFCSVCYNTGCSEDCVNFQSSKHAQLRKLFVALNQVMEEPMKRLDQIELEYLSREAIHKTTIQCYKNAIEKFTNVVLQGCLICRPGRHCCKVCEAAVELKKV